MNPRLQKNICHQQDIKYKFSQNYLSGPKCFGCFLETHVSVSQVSDIVHLFTFFYLNIELMPKHGADTAEYCNGGCDGPVVYFIF